MTQPLGSTAVAEPIPSPPYRLRAAAGRRDLLVDWSDLVVALAGRTQIWHGPRACEVAPLGVGAAAELARALATTAACRATRIYAADSPAAPSWPTVSAEAARQLTLSDGRVARVLALTGWPAVVVPNWLAGVADLAAVIALHLQPLPKDLGQRLLRRRLTSLTSTASVDEQVGRLADPELAVAAEAAQDLWDGLVRGQTRLIRAQLLVGLTADTSEDVDTAERAVQQVLAGVLAEVRTLSWQQAPAWAALAPGAGPVKWPWRLIDAETAAATIPHPVGVQRAHHGTLVGLEPQAAQPVLLDRFSGHNPTRLVVGTSGAGKSYAAKIETMRHLAADPDATAIVVDPEGEFSRLGQVLGGLVLAVGEEPAGLDPVGLACRPSLGAAEGVGVLASWAAALLGEPLSGVDLALLDRALTVLRGEAARATRASSASTLRGSTTADLLGVITELAAFPPFTGADLPARLAPAAHGSIADLFAPNPHLADPPRLVVFDLRSVPARVRPAVMACVLAWTWAETLDATLVSRRLLVIDEAHLLLDDPPAAELLAQFARRARKYRVGLEIVTQRLSDFLGHPAGEAVLANAATKLLLGCEDHERHAVVAGLGLSGPEADLLRPGVRGRGLLITPELRAPLWVIAAEAEHELAATGPRLR